MTNDDLIQVEISLVEPEPKRKIKKDLFEIFNDLDINDETELSLISYGVLKPDSVHKIVICFKSKNTAEKFVDYLNIEENLKKYNFIDIIKTNFTNSKQFNRRLSTSSTDSVYIISDDKYQTIHDNLTMETSFYDKSVQNSALNESSILSSTAFIESTLNKSISQISLKSNDDEVKLNEASDDTIVEFYSDHVIHDGDLEVLMLFLENVKQSGGADSVEHRLDASKRLLTVKYETNEAKKRVLEKHVFNFKVNSNMFKLIANEPLTKSSYKRDNTVLILRNIKSSIEDTLIRIYAENLVVNDDEDNDVDKLIHSLIYKDTVYIKYKHDFDIEKVKKRIQKRPKLHDLQVIYLEAFKTNIILVKQYDTYGQRISKDLLEIYFLNKKRCGADPYSSIHEREPFLLLTYDDNENCEKILSRKHEISKHILIVEGLYNFDLFEEELKHIEAHNLHEHKHKIENIKGEKEEEKEAKIEEELDRMQEPEQAIVVSDEFMEKEKKFHQIEIKQEEERQVEKLFLDLNIKQEPRLKVLYEFDESLFKEFNDELLDRQGECVKKQNEYEIEINCTCDLPTNLIEYNHLKHKWQRDILVFIKSYFDQFKIEKLRIKNPDEWFKNNDYDKMRLNIRKLDNNKIDSLYELTGFKELVDRFKFEIEKENLRQDKLETEIIEEKIQDLNLAQIRILFINKFIKQMKDKYNGMSVIIFPKQLKVEFKGTKKQIDDAKSLLNEIKSSIVSKSIPADRLLIKLFEKKEADIVNWLKEKECLCVLMPDAKSNLITIYSTDKNELEKCAKLVQDEIKFQDIDQNLTEDLDKQLLVNFVDRNLDAPGIIMELQDGVIKTCGFKEFVKDMFEKFITENLFEQ